MNKNRAAVVYEKMSEWMVKKGIESLEDCQRCGSFVWVLDRPLGNYYCQVCGRSRYHNDLVHSQNFNLMLIAEEV